MEMDFSKLKAGDQDKLLQLSTKIKKDPDIVEKYLEFRNECLSKVSGKTKEQLMELGLDEYNEALGKLLVKLAPNEEQLIKNSKGQPS